MNGFKSNIVLKIIAVILSFLAVLTMVFSVVIVAILVNFKFYFSDEETVTAEVITSMADNEAGYIASRIDDITMSGEYTYLNEYYEDKNVLYTVINRETSEQIASNYNGEKYIAKGYSEGYEITETQYKYGEYITDETVYDVTVYIPEKMTKNDLFSFATTMVKWGFKYQYTVIFLGILSAIIFIATVSYLLISAGYTSEGVKCNFVDKIPFDLYTAILTVAIVFSLILLQEFLDYGYDVYGMVFAIILAGVWYFFGLGYLVSISTRIKTQTLFKNTVCYKIYRKICSVSVFVAERLPFIYKVVLFLIGGYFILFILIHFVISFLFDGSYGFEAFLLWSVMYIPVSVVTVYLAVVFSKIKEGGEKIVKGDLEHKIDTNYMFGEIKDFALSLNNINQGLQTAVDEKMKSEKFKTELITNVSHDIKTPLTSIINYVDLIKKEEYQNETVKQYVEVLDRQSNRLKKLVGDLIEASKVSSGSIAVDLMPCDVTVLLTQVLGEFEDRISKSRIVPIVSVPERSLIVIADGRHMWRIFDNLMSNICKYSLEGTRVYISVTQQNKSVIITFRNISKYQLEVSDNELFERFVRGDKSRTTEGSGLGLSIAKSLAELQGGSMDLSVDGDLFKVAVKFNIEE